MRKRLPWLVTFGVFVGMIVALHLEGRLWTCSCGYILLWSGNIFTADNSQHFFDPYTFTHIVHGFLFLGLVHLFWPRVPKPWKFTIAMSAEMLWEVIENNTFIIDRYRSETISIGYVGDTILNSSGDILACALGIFIARKIGLLRAVLLALLMELILALTIRDNLLLNIIMLLYPVEAIRAWQAGH